MSLTKEQKACNSDTFRHIERVRNLLNLCVRDLMKRGEEHDQSKLESPEVEYFAKYTPQLAKLTYNTPEYNQCLKDMDPALQHHYANNDHHPQHFPNGVNDMTLLHLVEMICDWKAASERHENGNILKSIEQNVERFKMDHQMKQIMVNTVKYLKFVE